MHAQLQRTQLESLPAIEVVDGMPGTLGTWPMLMLLLPSERARDKALSALWQRGLGVSRMFIHALPDYAYLRGVVADAEPRSSTTSPGFSSARAVGNSPWLTHADTGEIVKVLARQ